jgi:hypothetical protein
MGLCFPHGTGAPPNEAAVAESRSSARMVVTEGDAAHNNKSVSRCKNNVLQEGETTICMEFGKKIIKMSFVQNKIFVRKFYCSV